MASRYNSKLQMELSSLRESCSTNTNFYNEIQKNYEMTYAGGCGGIAGKCNHCDATGTKAHQNYFKIIFPDDVVPEHVKKCICGIKIKENCYIQCEEGLIIVGNECINRFIQNSDKGRRTCGFCGDRHRNRKDNYCNTCRKKIEEERIKKERIRKEKEQEMRCIMCNKMKKSDKYATCYSCYKHKLDNLGPEWFCNCGKKKGKSSYRTCWYCRNNSYQHSDNDIKCSMCQDHPSGMYACEGMYIQCVDCGGGCGGE